MSKTQEENLAIQIVREFEKKGLTNSQAGIRLNGGNAAQFRDGLERDGRPAAGAEKPYPDPAWEGAVRALGEVWVSARGAYWFRQSERGWQLLKADHVEAEDAVRDLLDHLGLPLRELVENGEEEAVYVGRLAALVQLGLPLRMERLDGPARAKGSNGQPQRRARGQEDECDAENSCRQQGADGSRPACRVRDPLLDCRKNFRAMLFRHFQRFLHVVSGVAGSR